jgi:hypothetical protein
MKEFKKIVSLVAIIGLIYFNLSVISKNNSDYELSLNTLTADAQYPPQHEWVQGYLCYRGIITGMAMPTWCHTCRPIYFAAGYYSGQCSRS